MNVLLIGISLYLTYYTFLLALRTWRGGQKWAGLFVFGLAGCFIPLSMLILQ
ncbi:hypothetical protein [Paenibacillus sp. GYB003]|uniref:hypothetical protein n=1 Tax=Paenibacillus sp. GYB003 TaxID=2994392 RepID=UPI002F96AC8D